MAVAAPFPVFWFGSQSALYGVAVQVAQFHVELIVVPHVAVIVAGLPERPRLAPIERARTWGTGLLRSWLEFVQWPTGGTSLGMNVLSELSRTCRVALPYCHRQFLNFAEGAALENACQVDAATIESRSDSSARRPVLDGTAGNSGMRRPVRRRWTTASVTA
jgi:hypothetical protein